MKKYLAIVTFSVLYAFNANATTINILNIEKVVKESKAMQDIQDKLAKKQKEYQKEINTKQAELEKEREKIEERKSTLSKEELEKESEKFRQKAEKLKEYASKKQNILVKGSKEAINKVNEQIREIIADISKERELDIVIPASQALFYKTEMDISDEILKKLNKRITEVEVEFN